MSKPGRGALALILALLLAAPAAQSASLAGYTSFWSLGDSLSDPGNLFAASGGTSPPSPPYHAGRFSNGPVWAEQVAGDFSARNLPTGNFAFGGARAVTNTEDTIPDLPTQIGMFAAKSQGFLGTRPVASIWIGANDLIANGIPGGTARASGRQAARAVASGALALGGLGVKDVAIFNLPDLGSTPAFALFQPELSASASAGTRAFNRVLERQIPRLERAGLNVIRVDMAGLFRAMLRDPQSFGVTDATTPCLIPGQPACTPAQALDRAFFDGVHPNSVLHSGIADVARGAIAPIPLPLPAALLLAGLAGLVFVARRRPA